MRKRILAISAALGLVALAGLGGGSLAAPDTALQWSVFGIGGGASSSTNYASGATLGQAGPIGPASSTNYNLGAGFWYGGCGDFDADAACDPQDMEDDGDGFSDVNEAGTPLCSGVVNNDNFDDTVVNDGCPGGPPQDGSFSEAQFKVGTGSLDPCGNNGWPLELVSTPAFTANRYNISDLGSFVSGIRKLGKNPNQAGFDARWDLVPGNSGLAGSGWINTVDLAATTGGVTGSPRMLGGVRALNQLCPYPP